jgi:hypothetical protein
MFLLSQFSNRLASSDKSSALAIPQKSNPKFWAVVFTILL